METRASYVLVGAFVLGLIVAGVFSVLWLAGGSGADQTKNFRIYFRGNITGLQNGSTVLFRGIPVGEVTKIDFFEENTELIEVRIKVRETTPVKTDTTAQVEAQLLSGSASVLLRGGSRDAPLLKPEKGKDYAVLQGRPSPFAEILPSARTALAKIGKVADQVSAILDENNQAEIKKLLKSGNDLVESAKKTVIAYGKFANQADRFVENLQPAAKELPGAIKSFKETGEEAQKLIRENRRPIRDFTASGLQEFNLFLVEARRFVRSFNRVLIKLENDPSGFLFGNQRKGFRGR